MNDSIFCKIVRRELPATILFEDDKILAFFDIAPINPGHTLIIPKEHHVSLTTVPDDILERMMLLAPKIAQAIVRAVDGDGFNLHLSNGTCAGQEIHHVHLHLIPRFPNDGFTWGWRTGKYKNETEKNVLAKKVIMHLEKKGLNLLF